MIHSHHIELVDHDEYTLSKGKHDAYGSLTNLNDETAMTLNPTPKNSRTLNSIVGSHGFLSEYGDDVEAHAGAPFKRQDFPPMPVKSVVLSIFLVISGIIFITAGLVSVLKYHDSENVFLYFLFGILLEISGGYYCVLLWQAYKAETPEDREKILDEIPS